MEHFLLFLASASDMHVNWLYIDQRAVVGSGYDCVNRRMAGT